MSKVEKLKEIIVEIKNIIKILENKNINVLKDREDYFWDNHYDIMNKYPFLVSQLCSGADNEMLNFMLTKIDEMDKTATNNKKMDEIVGQKIVDKFVKPNLDKNNSK